MSNLDKKKDEEEGEIKVETRDSTTNRRKSKRPRWKRSRSRGRDRSRDRYTSSRRDRSRRHRDSRKKRKTSHSDNSSNGSYRSHSRRSKHRKRDRKERDKRRSSERRDRYKDRYSTRDEIPSSKNLDTKETKLDPKEDTSVKKEPSITEDNVFINMEDEEERLKREQEERERRIKEIMSKHNKTVGKEPQDSQAGQYLEPSQTNPDEEQKDDLSANSEKDEELKKMDEENVKLLKMLQQERLNLEKSTEKAAQPQEEKEENKSEASGESFDMFNFDSDGEDNQNIINKAVDQGIKIQSDDINVDADGYYQPRIGEIITASSTGKQYKIASIAGKGVFSVVVKAEDVNSKEDDEHKLVGIKIIRLRDIMVLSGNKEKDILKDLNEGDACKNRYIIRMIDHFYYRKHLCIVFEHMHLNLREILKKYGKSIGLSLQGVKMYATQLLIALDFLRRKRIIHADLKPDNILVQEDLSKIKLCDFGTAFSVDERTITEYLASGFYRAPEVIIGCNYDTQIDVWAAGVSLYEIYTGDVMFPGDSNTEMLRLIMEIKGRISTKMLKKGEYTSKHFDSQSRLLVRDLDPHTKQIIFKPTPVHPSPTKSLADILTKKRSKGDDPELLKKFADFLEKCLRCDPRKRLTPSEALHHPFIKDQC
ncbi:unnamed protein product [Moneuplotes crassus]|uniref:non-specific serine/threonine protein kinase n=1 Tax=Euplotes crassus TaxID=5936 RepID=A0AAD1U0E3_EUPCR|nr:unnamed protein product [Moneuplotes crassus]